ncbi:MAG: ATP-binding cassette domain-containing protein [Acidilobaceae archaeon]
MNTETPLLEVSNLRKYFGGVRAVDGVSFRVYEGELIFLIGPNGAGKTTLVNLISGYLKPDSGLIAFNGRDISRLDMASRVKLGIARSFQFVNVSWSISLLENIAIAIASRRGINLSMLRSLESHTDVIEEAIQLAKLVGLEKNLDKLPLEVSHGDRKILDVVMTLALKPKLLLLDEPTSGVSTRDKFDIIDRIVSAIKATGISSIIVEHDMDIVFSYANRIIAMHSGRILADGSPEDVRSREDVRAVLLGGLYA